MSSQDQGTLRDVDGITVGYRRWARRDPAGILLVLHGACEHGRRYERFANEAVEEGWAVYAIDHRGHGRTSPSRDWALLP